MDFKTLKKEDSEAWAVDREDNYFETHTLEARNRRNLEEKCRREEAAAEAKTATRTQLEAFEQRRARDRSEASAAAKEALRREATRVLKAQEREKQKAVREARELKAAKALAQREREVGARRAQSRLTVGDAERLRDGAAHERFVGGVHVEQIGE